MEKYLIINAGSSSLKFSLYEIPGNIEVVNGYFERIGKPDSFYTLKYGDKKDIITREFNTHTAAVNIMLEELINRKFVNDLSELIGVGHRVLHGGELYSESVVIDDKVLDDIKNLTKLGPLHHPGEIAGIKSMMEVLPKVPQVAVFDTAFHQTIPKENYLYAVPYDWYTQDGVRKYGFHGTSHKYITEKLQELYGKDDINAIICHIGSGASISCIKDGKCYDTSMGLTPLDGLVMGTRCGSIDPSIIQYISKERNLTIDEVTELLNKNSGLIGICGQNDNRDIVRLIEQGDEQAILAMNLLKNSIVKYIAQYYVELEGKVDALVFTAGIGENGIYLREKVVNAISKPLGVGLNKEVNDTISKQTSAREGKISTEGSNFDIYVLPTNEEYIILKDTVNAVKKQNGKVLNYIPNHG